MWCIACGKCLALMNAAVVLIVQVAGNVLQRKWRGIGCHKAMYKTGHYTQCELPTCKTKDAFSFSAAH